MIKMQHHYKTFAIGKALDFEARSYNDQNELNLKFFLSHIRFSMDDDDTSR